MDFNQLLDDNDLLNGPCRQERCKWCERYFDPPLSEAKDWEHFCSPSCQEASEDAERIR